MKSISFFCCFLIEGVDPQILISFRCLLGSVFYHVNSCCIHFQLIVTVQDVNDNAPAFNSSVYNLTMIEESSNGTFVGLVTATDPDKDPKV